MSTNALSISKWWFQKWLKYNKALLFTGLIGFVIQVVQECSFANKLITRIQFDMQMSGVCFILFLILANVAFAIGSVIDILFNSQNSRSFRDRLFLGGYWFAIAALISFMIAFLFLH